MPEKSFFKKAKLVAKKTSEVSQPFASKVAESVGNLTDATTKKYEESGVKEKVATFANTTSKKYEESGAKERVEAVTGKVSEQFDVLSGQAIFQAVQDNLAKQDQYNDVLANKLLEALDRIKQLEDKIGYTK
jgi:hypothetical protein